MNGTDTIPGAGHPSRPPEGTPTHVPCCSSHGQPMDCARYRRTHFVEVRPCCAADAAALAAEGDQGPALLLRAREIVRRWAAWATATDAAANRPGIEGDRAFLLALLTPPAAGEHLPPPEPTGDQLAESRRVVEAWHQAQTAGYDLDHLVAWVAEAVAVAEQRAEARGYERGRRDFQFEPSGDNHHNAALCPYCSPPGDR